MFYKTKNNNIYNMLTYAVTLARDSIPSTSRTRPPVGKARGALHDEQMIGTFECE